MLKGNIKDTFNHLLACLKPLPYLAKEKSAFLNSKITKHTIKSSAKKFCFFTSLLVFIFYTCLAWLILQSKYKKLLNTKLHLLTRWGFVGTNIKNYSPKLLILINPTKRVLSLKFVKTKLAVWERLCVKERIRDYSSAKKSFPLSSITIKAGKFSEVVTKFLLTNGRKYMII